MADPKRLQIIKGGLNFAKRLLAPEEVTAARARGLGVPGVDFADPIAPASMRMSEALGNAGAEGKTLNFTEADRSRVFGPNRGGIGFSGLQHYSKPHKKANTVWGFGNTGVAEKKIRQNDPENSLWTTFVGSPTQHRSNSVVIGDAIKEFQKSVKQGVVPVEQIMLMNKRLNELTDQKTGAKVFENGFDLTDPSALSVANTFARRAAVGDVMLGLGVKGPMARLDFKNEFPGTKFVDASNIENILKRETDPDLVNANTYDVGNRLFVLDGKIIQRPDLNEAFPVQVTGNDLGMKFGLVPPDTAMRDFYKAREGRLDKNQQPSPVSYYDLARAEPSQVVDEDYLTYLQKAGYKEGGAVDMEAADARLAQAIQARMEKGGSVDMEAADARLQAAIQARMGGEKVAHMAGGGGKLKALGDIAKKFLVDAPQAEALKLAQQRAALPKTKHGLGLPADNTPEQRAKAMGGKDKVHFSRHGGDYTTLDSGKFAIAPFDAVGTHVGTPEAAMERYQNTVGYKVNNPNYANDELKGVTYPVTILGDRPMMNQNGMPFGEDDLNAFLRQQGGHNWSDTQGGKMTYQDMNAKLRKKLFEEQGYTSIPYYNEVEGKGSISYIVPPDNIRSCFAAFDPFRRNAATAAAMGVLAPDLMAEETKKAQGGLMMAGGGDPLDQFSPPRYRSAGRRPENQNDRRAAANMPMDFARGVVSGIGGALGDLESFVRMIPGLERSRTLSDLVTGDHRETYLPTSEEIEKRLPLRSDTPAGRAAAGLGTLAGGFYTGPGAPIRLVGGLPQAVYKAGKDFGRAAGQPATNVVKPTGGDFLTGRTEKDLKLLKSRGPTNRDEALLMGGRFAQMADDPENIRIMAQDAALNKWIDSNLTNYVKKKMGTPDDPVRKLAEQGITHKPALLDEHLHEPLSGEQLRRAEYVEKQRKAAGFPKEGMGQSPMAKAWEISSDDAIATYRAGDIQGMPEKVAKMKEAELKVNAAQEAVERKFKQQIENAGLDLDNITNFHYGATHLDKAKIVGDTDLAKAMAEYQSYQSPMMDRYIEIGRQNPFIAKLDPNTSLYSTYTQNLGFDHIMDVLREDVAAGRIRPEQLNKVSMEQAVRRTYQYDQELAAKMNASRAAAREGLPTYREYPEGYKWIQLNKPGSFAQESEAMGHSVRGYEPPKGHPDWTEASGDAGSSGYGHGGWEAIKSGKAKVYSLVDSKGAPHATVEVEQIGMTPEQRRYKIGFLAAQLEKEGKTAEDALRQAEKIYPEESKESISQIKGKGNRAPNEEYLPYIQDFVRGGKWSDVRDIQNTGLSHVGGKYFTEPELVEAATKYGRMGVQDTPWEVARQRHIDAGVPEETALENWVEGFREGRGRLDIPPEGMAHGGLLHMADAGRVGRGLLAQFSKRLLQDAPPPALKIKPPSDNVANVRQANFQYPKTIGNQTVAIDKLSGGVRMSDPKEVKRVKALADQMSGPEGYISRIVVDHNNNVIEGQHRLEALRQLGVKDVPVFKIEDLADTMPVSKMEEAMREVGGIHSNHVNQLMQHALDDISEGGIEGARQLDYGKFQKHYDAALDAVSGMSPVLPAAIKKPYELKSMHDWYDIPGANDTEKTNLLKSQGYDGVKYPHGAGGDSTSPSPNVYVAFEPEQIKSATGNRGTYDITDADISKAEGGPAFKKLQFMDDGGIASPEENITSDQKPNRFSRVASKMYDEYKQSLANDYERLKTSAVARAQLAKIAAAQLAGGSLDFASMVTPLVNSDALLNAFPMARAAKIGLTGSPSTGRRTSVLSDEKTPYSLADYTNDINGNPRGGSEDIIKRAQKAGLMYGGTRMMYDAQEPDPSKEMLTMTPKEYEKWLNSEGRNRIDFGEQITTGRFSPFTEMGTAILGGNLGNKLVRGAVNTGQKFKKGFDKGYARAMSRNAPPFLRELEYAPSKMRGGLTQLKAR